MPTADWRTQLLEALEAALRQGYSITQIGEEAAIRPQHLYNARSKGYLAADNARRLERWLSDHGQFQQTEPGIRAFFLAELQSLLDRQRDPGTDELVKVRDLAQTIKRLHDILAEVGKAIDGHE